MTRFLVTMSLLFGFAGSALAQSTWFVNPQSGSNTSNGQSAASPFETIAYAIGNTVQPGDTVKLMGLFSNPSFDPNYAFTGNISDPHLWHGENSFRLNNLDGAPGAYITFMAYDSSTVLKGDGANIVRVSNSSYLRFEGLEVQGQVDSIPLSTAEALQFLWDSAGTVVYRVPPGTPDSIIETMTFVDLGPVQRPSYTDTRGMYFSNVHHIDIINNEIHHMPGGGLRVSECDYINIEDNEVHNCSRKSFSGTHGLVVTKATSFDTLDTYKINLLRNRVHHNYNEIYSWAPTKTIITPFIDEGKGISMQRNDTTNGDWRHGRFLIANNLAYWNGYSGVHSNGGMRMDFVNNTCYLNSYTKSVTYPGTTTGGNIGISTSEGDDIRIVNNIVVIDGNLSKSAIAAANTIGLVVADNIIYGTLGPISEDPDVVAVQVNMRMVDPLFVDAVNFDFGLQQGSPAIDSGNVAFAPLDDFYGSLRDMSPDLGAIEYELLVGNEIGERAMEMLAFPNPVNGIVHIYSTESLGNLQLFDLQGREASHLAGEEVISEKEVRLDLSKFPSGIYLVKGRSGVLRLVKH